MKERRMIRISYDDGSPPDFCSLDEFIASNSDLDPLDVNRIVGGQRVAFGGGAQPCTIVDMIDVDEVIAAKLGIEVMS
jgi:uncharacterized ParB-like nuclease family protein